MGMSKKQRKAARRIDREIRRQIKDKVERWYRVVRQARRKEANESNMAKNDTPTTKSSMSSIRSSNFQVVTHEERGKEDCGKHISMVRSGGGKQKHITKAMTNAKNDSNTTFDWSTLHTENTGKIEGEDSAGKTATVTDNPGAGPKKANRTMELSPEETPKGSTDDKMLGDTSLHFIIFYDHKIS